MRFLNDDRVVVADSSNQLRFIAAGLPRCATSSIQEALESKWLGCNPSMHMAHIFPHPERGELVCKAIREQDRAKRQKLLHELYDGYLATSDFPGICFIEDLMDMYPDAVIVLNQRESAKAWADSFGNSLAFFDSWFYCIVCFLWRSDRVMVDLHAANYEYFNRLLRLPRVKDEEMNIRWYTMYNDHVRKVAKERGRKVLEWKPKDGWKPLCEVLGKPVPPADVPFPRVNDAQAVRTIKIILVTRGILSWVALGSAVYGSWVYGPGLLVQAKGLVRSYLGF